MGIVLAQGSGEEVVFGASVLLFYLALLALYAVSFYRLFTKAGEDGWKALVPIYNVVVWLRIIGRPGWWVLLYVVPFVNIVIILLTSIDAVRSYGYHALWALVLIFFTPIGYAYLAFSDARYVGPAGGRPREGWQPPGQSAFGGPGQGWGQQGLGQPGWGNQGTGQPGWGQPGSAQEGWDQSGWGQSQGGWGSRPEYTPPPQQPWEQPGQYGQSGQPSGSFEQGSSSWAPPSLPNLPGQPPQAGQAGQPGQPGQDDDGTDGPPPSPWDPPRR